MPFNNGIADVMFESRSIFYKSLPSSKLHLYLDCFTLFLPEALNTEKYFSDPCTCQEVTIEKLFLRKL